MADFDPKEVRELLAHAEDADRENREEAILDLRFEGYDQWDERDRIARELKQLPVITNNIVQQYTGMVVGDWLQNETAIKVLPREDADVETAEVLSELLRSIELQSKAPRVYEQCLGQMVSCGIANMRVDVDYAYEDAFDKDIFIRAIADPLAVRWDPLAYDPTGRDASYCFVGDEMTKEDYEKKYPDAAEPTMLERELRGTSWYQNNTILVPEYLKMTEKLRTFGMTADGKTVDLTDIPQRKWPKLAVDADTGQKIVREKVKCKYAVSVMTNGLEELSDPYELKLSRLPIVRVMGREVRVEGKRIRFGLIRAMRDHQRMINYLASIRSELLMRAARVNFVADAAAIEGREEDWDNTLTHNAGTPAPTEVTGRNLQALLSEEQFLSQGIMNVTGIHEANRGMQGNETSGRAILARQNEGDTATVVYHNRMTDAQQELGEIIVELRPTVYDTSRTIRTVGPDLGVKMVRINDPHAKDAYGNPALIDLTVGKYDVTVSTGASFQTRRQEAQTALSELFRADPQATQIYGDLFVGSLDIPNSEQYAERARRAMDPRILGDDANDGKSPEELADDKAKAQQAEQMQQTSVMLEMRAKEADTNFKEAQATKAQADAEKAQTDAAKAKLDMMQTLTGGAPDPSVAAEEQRTAIMGYDAVTRRIAAVEKGNMPGTPPLLAQHLAPIISNAVGQALARHLGFAPVELGLPTAEPQTPPDEGIAA